MYISEFFSASNGGIGFFSLFGECFSDCSRLFIIKGGPGTGKSSLMRKIAESAEAHGFTAERIYCSSDPLSLDGLRIYANGEIIAFADGTAPHVLDAELPGVRDFLLNLGDNWDENMLKSHKERIKKLKIGKSAAYARAYRFLSAAADCDAVISDTVAPCLNFNTLRATAERQFSRLRASDAFEHRRIFLSAYGMCGRYNLFPFGSDVKTISVDRTYGGSDFLRLLKVNAIEKGVSFCEVSAPLTPEKTDGIYFPNAGIFYTLCPCGTANSHISLRNASDAECFAKVRVNVRRYKKLREELLGCALEELAAAGAFHSELEKIYVSAMDFRKNDILCRNLCGKLFGNA